MNRWVIKTSGLSGDGDSVTPSDLAPRARNIGVHLLECSGNNNPANFGPMSVSEQDGVPLSDVLSRLRLPSDSTSVVVSGMDFNDARPRGCIDGASQVFSFASPEHVGAFLAVRMNGEPVPPDHGAPVRFVVPGWYGWTWI